MGVGRFILPCAASAILGWGLGAAGTRALAEPEAAGPAQAVVKGAVFHIRAANVAGENVNDNNLDLALYELRAALKANPLLAADAIIVVDSERWVWGLRVDERGDAITPLAREFLALGVRIEASRPGSPSWRAEAAKLPASIRLIDRVADRLVELQREGRPYVRF